MPLFVAINFAVAATNSFIYTISDPIFSFVSAPFIIYNFLLGRASFLDEKKLEKLRIVNCESSLKKENSFFKNRLW